MFIDYNLGSNVHTFRQLEGDELVKLSFLLTNSRGDFLNLGVLENSCKYQGFSVCRLPNVEFFKFVESVFPVGLDVKKVEYCGDKVVRYFKSSLTESVSLTYSESENGSSSELGDVDLDGVCTKDSFFVGPTGGFIYEISDFEGDLVVDLDFHKKNDFSKTGREYKVFTREGRVYVEFTKDGERGEYKQFFGISGQNISLEEISKFVRKEYEYTRLQKSHWKWNVFRLGLIKVFSSKRLFFGCGFSFEEVDSQLELLEKHELSLREISHEKINKEFDLNYEFREPIQERTKLAFDLSRVSCYRFLKNDLGSEKVGVGCFTGFPYFTNVWGRDDIFGLRAFINLGEVGLVKERINFYLGNLDLENGGLRNLLSRDSKTNCDIVFLLCKRIEDFLFYLIDKDELFDVYSKKELRAMFQELSLAFKNIVKFNWDFDLELLRVKNFKGFRDGFVTKFPLSLQVQFLSFISFMGVLGKAFGVSKKELNKFLEFEELLKLKVRDAYWRNGVLFDDVCYSRLSYSLFSAYYFYPSLFEPLEWEEIFDRGLMDLKNGWSGISSLSSSDFRFVDEHSGSDRKSVNFGDSFFFMNHLTAICLFDLNEQKYRGTISKIVSASVDDILVRGNIGFCSELSSSFEQRAEGNLSHFTSSSSFIEMIDLIYGRNF